MEGGGEGERERGTEGWREGEKRGRKDNDLIYHPVYTTHYPSWAWGLSWVVRSPYSPSQYNISLNLYYRLAHKAGARSLLFPECPESSGLESLVLHQLSFLHFLDLFWLDNASLLLIKDLVLNCSPAVSLLPQGLSLLSLSLARSKSEPPTWRNHWVVGAP